MCFFKFSLPNLLIITHENKNPRVKDRNVIDTIIFSFSGKKIKVNKIDRLITYTTLSRLENPIQSIFWWFKAFSKSALKIITNNPINATSHSILR
jgi:hypothetical protein